MEEKLQPVIVAVPPKKGVTVGKVLGYSLLAGGTFLAVRYVVREWRKGNEEKNADDDISTQHAMVIRGYIKQWFGGSEAILNIAKQGINADEVAKSYKKLYNDDFYEDIRKKLSSSDHSLFLKYIKENKATTETSSTHATDLSYTDARLKEKLVLTSREARALHSPRDKYNPFHSIRVIPKNSFIRGGLSGVVFKLESIYGDTLFYQVLVKTDADIWHKVWIEKDNLIVTTATEYKAKYKSSYSNKVIFKESDFD
jgi:hypothetical protein